MKISQIMALEDIILTNDTITSTDLIRRKWLENDFTGIIIH